MRTHELLPRQKTEIKQIITHIRAIQKETATATNIRIIATLKNTLKGMTA